MFSLALGDWTNMKKIWDNVKEERGRGMNFIGGQCTEWTGKEKEGSTGAGRVPFCLELQKSSNPTAHITFGEIEARGGDGSP